MSRLDLRPVVVGAAVAGGLAIAVALMLRFVSDTSNLGFGVFAAVMCCMALGGFLAARPQPELALTAGAVAAGIASVNVQVLDLLSRIVRGKEVPASFLIGSVFVALLSCSFGIVGGAVVLWRDRNSTPTSTSEEASP